MDLLRIKRHVKGLSADEEKTWHETRTMIIENIMNMDIKDLFEIKDPEGQIPQKANIAANLICEKCGESVMETRTRRFREMALCIPCFDSVEQRC